MNPICSFETSLRTELFQWYSGLPGSEAGPPVAPEDFLLDDDGMFAVIGLTIDCTSWEKGDNAVVGGSTGSATEEEGIRGYTVESELGGSSANLRGGL